GGRPTPISPEITQLVEEVARDVGIESHQIPPLFTTLYLEDVFCFGRIGGVWGAQLGYPGDWHLSQPSEVDLTTLRFGVASHDQEIKLKPEVVSLVMGKKLQKTLILSDNGKRFGIARELLRGQTGFYHIKSLALSVNVMCFIAVIRFLREKRGLAGRPKTAQAVIYGFVATIWGLIYVLMNDRVRDQFDSNLDRRAAELGRDYALGGVELYSKLIKKRQLLRSMVEKDKAKNYYSVRGDVYPGLVRSKGVRTTVRKTTCFDVLNSKFEGDAVSEESKEESTESES
ncbi:hypothetical protein TCAL_14121, partial [Tigriopus californicus]